MLRVLDNFITYTVYSYRMLTVVDEVTYPKTICLHFVPLQMLTAWTLIKNCQQSVKCPINFKVSHSNWRYRSNTVKYHSVTVAHFK